MASESRSMKLWQWIVATTIGGVSAGVSIVTFLQSLVYTNAQGRGMEVRVHQIESRIKEVETAQRTDLSQIRDKIDEIYKILIKRTQNE